MSDKVCPVCGVNKIPARYRKCDDCLTTRPSVASTPRRPRAEVRVFDESRGFLVASEARWVDLNCGCSVWSVLLPNSDYDRPHDCDYVFVEDGEVTWHKVVRVSAVQAPDPTVPSTDQLMRVMRSHDSWVDLGLSAPDPEVSYRDNFEDDTNEWLIDPATGKPFKNRYDQPLSRAEFRVGPDGKPELKPTRGSVSNRTNREAFEAQR